MFYNLPGFCLEFIREAARESTSNGVSIMATYVLTKQPRLKRFPNHTPSYKASEGLALELFVRQSVNSFTKALQNKY